MIESGAYCSHNDYIMYAFKNCPKIVHTCSTCT